MSVTKRLHSCGCLSASHMGGGREVGNVCNRMVVWGVSDYHCQLCGCVTGLSTWRGVSCLEDCMSV